MNYRTTAKFWQRYYDLPQAIQELADKNFDLLKQDSTHPSLHFKQLQNRKGTWAARVGEHYRALAQQEGDNLYWFWIGSHAEYDRLISK